MSDLNLGGPKELTFSQPSPVYIDGEYVSDGWVWMGTDECTDDDREALNDFCLEHGYPVPPEIDPRSVVGLHHPDWNSHWYLHSSGDNKPGGLGSDAYELQLIGYGVQMTRQPIWHYDSDGDFVKERPANFAYHKAHVGGGYYDNVEGPEPGSEAEQLLGAGRYKWSRTRKLWKIVQ